MLIKFSSKRAVQISEMYGKLRLAMTTLKLELQKQKEISSDFLIASLDKGTYFRTQQKVTAETERRKEVTANLGKLWNALKILTQEENEKRREFNKSRYFNQILQDDKQRELKHMLPVAEISLMQQHEDAKITPSILASLRSFANEGKSFQSESHQRTILQPLL